MNHDLSIITTVATPRKEDYSLDMPLFQRKQIPKEQVKFDLPSRYVYKNVIGQGAQGVVAEAFDLATGVKVAIKKSINIFTPPNPNAKDPVQELKRSTLRARRVLRELQILHKLNHPNLANLRDVIVPPNISKFQDIYVVNDLMDADLNTIIKSKILQPKHIKYITYQLLSAMRYVHECDIVHRDVKPHNILINSKCHVRLCDFGISCYLDEKQTAQELELESHLLVSSSTSPTTSPTNSPPTSPTASSPTSPTGKAKHRMSTSYVQTRYYRAPEVILGWDKMGRKMDVWSIGCIMAEMFVGRVFLPGSSSLDQMVKIMSLFGNSGELKGCEAGLRFAKNVGTFEAVPLETLDCFQGVDSSALDLLKQLLRVNPDERITCEEALEHPYFQTVFSEKDLKYEGVKCFDENVDYTSLDINHLKKLCFETVIDMLEVGKSLKKRGSYIPEVPHRRRAFSISSSPPGFSSSPTSPNEKVKKMLDVTSEIFRDIFSHRRKSLTS